MLVFRKSRRACSLLKNKKTKNGDEKMKVSKTVFESILKKARKRFPNEKGVAAFPEFAKKGYATFVCENCTIKINDYGFAIAYAPGAMFAVFGF